ncbi:MAG: family 20 glycosylhydrolase [Mucilaginibacter sp.]
MHKKFVLLLLVLTTSIITLATAQDNGPNLGIIPAPVSLKKTGGQFILSQQTAFIADSPDNKAVLFLADFLRNKKMLNMQPKVSDNKNINNSLVLTSAGADSLPAEGYKLTITPQNITINGKGAGLFYGIQTLVQLIDDQGSATITLPCVQITDYPRFGYRGLMLDVCRHFFPVEFVKKYIDLMAAYKLNNFHWHLTDDQGWRIEIKKYPRLTEIGSQRAQTLIGNYHDRFPQQFDNTPYGGYYTQDQIREVVKYAADRYINVIPEIEMPGHSSAALAAYPELSCDPNYPYKVSETWGVFHDTYCPSDKTFAFLEDVLTEVMDLFPSKYIHIGGDEAPKDAWKKSAFCQHLCKKLGLRDDRTSSKEDKLQSYFIQRIEQFVNSKGRSIIGWDEILEGGLSPNATVMSWRGESGGIAAAQQNHNVIMTPGSAGLYLDHGQGKLSDEPLTIGGNEPLSKIYSYNPTPLSLTPDQQKHIIGVQANLWTEYIATEAKVEYQLLPRMFALSEIAWTPLANKNFADFAHNRLPQHLAWLDKNGFDYHVPTAIGAVDTVMFGQQLSATLKAPVKGATIYYTIDGYTPRETDLAYNTTLNYPVPQDQYRELKTIVLTPSGKRSTVVSTMVYNKSPLPPVTYTGNTSGVKYQFFEGSFNSISDLASAAVIDTGVVRSFNPLALRKNNPSFGIIYSGFIRIDSDNVYGFSTLSDDGSELQIDNVTVVRNDGKHPQLEQGGAVPLQKGYHRFTLKYFNVGSAGTLHVYLTLPGHPKGELSPADLFN